MAMIVITLPRMASVTARRIQKPRHIGHGIQPRSEEPCNITHGELKNLSCDGSQHDVSRRSHLVKVPVTIERHYRLYLPHSQAMPGQDGVVGIVAFLNTTPPTGSLRRGLTVGNDSGGCDEENECDNVGIQGALHKMEKRGGRKHREDNWRGD
jgi:hypothetical protein